MSMKSGSRYDIFRVVKLIFSTSDSRAQAMFLMFASRQQMRLFSGRKFPDCSVQLAAANLRSERGQLCADSCFAFYNPVSSTELEHYVNSWLENLVAASEYVVANPRPNRNAR